jgi:uncharacterized membrane protein YeiB
MLIIIGLALYAVLSIIPATAAKWRGRNPVGWFFFSLLVTPVITTIVLVIEALLDQETGKDIRVKCRSCGSLNAEDANYCSDCGAEM